ncbi:mechanosensitive ion channel [Cytophagaceae bacterium DM2B3-1]|uniref:Mechanosensitive ion channel n=1 Tax=Xanthocytophaga flava TaxID=3048013 RepID=A0AAE3QWP7_9BACT|nr:mechanosensitive ion channel domain-containing protein [Xanthocytophaga flavus]MDJ1472746.1 mechanosensitive ion channel [Xanthocytophaga flavus]MDJ1484179.1 mechanosensitive ion channel [Xanthocytophaga flavus]MDJ1496127.1 mechanosensitive ion channel [Xanthocytophaga flavus]
MKDEIIKLLEFSILKVKGFNLTVFDLLAVISIIFVSRWLVWILNKILKRRFFNRLGIDEGRQFTFKLLVKYFIYLISILVAFQFLGIDLSLILAGSAALLVGVGLGLQQTFNDLISGLILLFEGNVHVGDVIEINNLIGRVVSIGIRTSKVETRDAITIIVPNSKFIVDNVINWSNNRTLVRFSVNVRASYETDPETVKKVLLEAVRVHNEFIAEKPAPFVRLQQFGEYAIEYHLMFWTYNVWRIENNKSMIRFTIYRLFKENGISMPFPQREITIKETSIHTSLDNYQKDLDGNARD